MNCSRVSRRSAAALERRPASLFTLEYSTPLTVFSKSPISEASFRKRRAIVKNDTDALLLIAFRNCIVNFSGTRRNINKYQLNAPFAAAAVSQARQKTT